jgi:hypothetical protein
MSNQSINSASNYHQGADQHRPTDPAILAASIRQLGASGLTAQDISALLRIGIGAVQQALRGDA